MIHERSRDQFLVVGKRKFELAIRFIYFILFWRDLFAIRSLDFHFFGHAISALFFWHSLLPTLIWVAGSNQRSGMWCELQRFLLQVVTWDENKGGYLVWLGLGLNLRVPHFSLFSRPATYRGGLGSPQCILAFWRNARKTISSRIW